MVVFFINLIKIKLSKMKIKWLTYSVSGLLVFGMGLSFLGEAIILKNSQSENWILYGTIALITTNSGLCLFGQGVIEKMKISLKNNP